MLLRSILVGGSSGFAEVSAPATAAASASSDEADSSESTSGSPAQVPTAATDQPNGWCVDGQFQFYSDAMFLTEKGVMTRTLTLEWQVLTGSLPTMPEIHNLFTRHQFEWTTRPLGRYSEEMVREFYASYVATLRSQIDRQDSPAKKPHRSRSEYRAYSFTFQCLPSAGFYMTRVLMLLGPISLQSLTTACRYLKMSSPS